MVQGLPVYTGRRMTGNYGPAAAGAAVLACDNYFDRTIYIGNVPPGTFPLQSLEDSQEP